MNDFHFLRPYSLFLIIPASLLALLLLRSFYQKGAWQKICSKDLIPYILTQKAGNYAFPYSLFTSLLLLLIIALSGPAWQMISQPLIDPKTALVIALDLSQSMDAEDIKPSRLKRAIYKIHDLLDMQKKGQIALIVFSQDPFVVTPLTEDRATIKNLLSSLETAIMPSHGHRIDLALAKANSLLQHGGLATSTSPQILLVTAEMHDHEKEIAIAEANKLHMQVCVLGVGGDAPAPIPKKEGGFVKNKEGAIVTTSLSHKNLHALAQATGGKFTSITVDDSDLLQLNQALNKTASTHEETSFTQNKWHDQGYLLVLLALPLASLLFRRGILVLLIFLLPQTAQALSWQTFWQSNDQQAQKLFDQKHTAEAGELFDNQEWKGICSYQLGNYELASELFQNVSTVEGLYNYGTARAKLEDFQNALDAYEKVLAQDPNHEDARHNKNIIEEHLKKQQDQQNKQQSQDKKNQQNRDESSQDQDQQNQQDHKNQQDHQDQKHNHQDEQDNKQEQQDKQDKKDKKQGDEKSKNRLNDQERDKQDKSSKQSGTGHKTRDFPHDEKQQNAKEDPAEEKKEISDYYRNQIDKELQKDKNENPSSKNKEDKKDDDPQQITDERWLKRVQDDPSGLLRRKFLLQYQKNQAK